LTSIKETSLLGDFVRTGLSNMHRCCAFPFALAGLFLFKHVVFDFIGRILAVNGCLTGNRTVLCLVNNFDAIVSYAVCTLLCGNSCRSES